MRTALLLLFAIALVSGTAIAGRNANGMMLVHTDDSIVYTATDDYCLSATPDHCVDFVNTSHKTPDEVTVVWLMAAFVASSSPGVTTLQFGIHHNLPMNVGYFERFAACGPGLIELPDQGWPEPNDCGNLVAYSTPVYDHAFPFYWFAIWHDDDTNFFGTRTYPSTNEAKFVDDGNPPVEDLCTNFATLRWNVPGEMNCIPDDMNYGACCYPDGSCVMTLAADCAGQFLGDHVPCDPNPCQLPWACCFADGTCYMLLEADCSLAGGVWLPELTCDMYPCGPTPPGACCFDDGHCEQLPDWDCQGEFHGPGTHCYSDTCPPAGACCLDMNGNCVILIQTACAEQGGVYQGDGETCAPENPCYGFPTQQTTWGRIKADYR